MAPLAKILQWNCQSVRSAPKKAEMTSLINETAPSIVALSETWLFSDSRFRVQGFACFREDRPDGWGGSALLVKNSLSFFPIPIPTHSDDLQVVALRVENCSILSIYTPRPSPLILQEVRSIISSCPHPILVLGDFNCHHPMWGCTSHDSSGDILLDIIDDLNMCLLNDGSPTVRNRPSENTSALDLSFCSSNLAAQITWEVLPSSFGSRHFPIILSFPTTIPLVSNPPLLKYQLEEANWLDFGKLLDANIGNLPEIVPLNVQECSDALCNTLIAAADLLFHKKKSSGKLSSPPWWDLDCTRLIKLRKAAERKYSTEMTLTNYIELNRVSAECRRTFRTKKFERWKAFCSSLSPQTPSSLVWKQIKRFRSSFSDLPNMSSLSQAWAENFMNKIAPPFVPHADNLPVPYHPYPTLDSWESPFSLKELRDVLIHSKSNSSPGLDGIPYSFFSHAKEATLKYFLNLINSVVDYGHIPTSWKSHIIIPILKPGKNPNDPNSYRPIALSSVLAKITEHMLKNRLEWFAESRGLLAKSQFGFRKGKGTIDSLSILTSTIRLAFSKNESVICAFLDISSAYDNVQLPLLRKKLQKLRMPTKWTNFIFNLFSNRSAHLRCNNPNIQCSRSLFQGLPQGSVLSPLLYSLYTHDLESSIPPPCCILQYADDVLLYVSDSDITKASELISHSLDSLGDWLDANGLKLSVAKSTSVIFTRKRSIPPVDIFIKNNVIPRKDHSKFLGLVLDSQLTGKFHLEHIANKCERNLNILRCLSGVWWGAHPFTLKILYNAIVRSVLDYGSFLLEPANKAGLRKLDLIQYKALRIILGAMKSSPTNALQVECGDPPLNCRRQFLSDRFLFRTAQYSHHPLFSVLENLKDSIPTSNYWTHKTTPRLVNSLIKLQGLEAPIHRSRKLPLFECPYETITFVPHVILNFGIRKGDQNAGSLFRFIMDRDWPEWHSIFTDASKLSPVGPTGYSVYHVEYNIIQKKKSPPETTVYTGECLALLEAIKYIQLFKLKKSLIFSDSLSSLQALLGYPYSKVFFNPILSNIIDLLRNCSQKGLQVYLAWIPGHSGIYGNEHADSAAKEAITCGDISPYIIYPHDLVLQPSRYLFDAWSSCWPDMCRTRGSYYASIQPFIPPKPWFTRLRLPKKSSSILSRLRLGHCCTPSHLAKLRIRDSSICECGLDVGDVNHIFLSCPLYDRSALLDSLIKHVPLPTNIPTLLSSFDPIIIYSLLRFVHINNIRL